MTFNVVKATDAPPAVKLIETLYGGDVHLYWWKKAAKLRKMATAGGAGNVTGHFKKEKCFGPCLKLF